MSPGRARRSLVDDAEDALRNWLAAGPHRAGDRLPPEQVLTGMLGVSRGTLRTALRRMEHTGEITRRQGSGTFVGHGVPGAALDEGLERLESYSSLARRRKLSLKVTDLEIARRPIGEESARAFGLEPGTHAPTVTRVLHADGHPAAYMVDVVRPDLPLPGEAALRRALLGGDMILDVLLANEVPIAFADTRVRPYLIAEGDREAKLLGVTGAALKLEELVHVTSGAVVHHGHDLFAPGGIDLHVVRWLSPGGPRQVAATNGEPRSVARRGRSE